NVTDQILTDVLPEPKLAPPDGRAALFTGAAAFGSDRTELFDAGAGEPGWNVTVLDAFKYTGVWNVVNNVLEGVTLTLAQPQLSLEGLFWLAKGAPTAQDALPTPDNWLEPMQSLDLRAPDPSDLYPAPFVVHFKNLSFVETVRAQNPYPGYSSATLEAI